MTIEQFLAKYGTDTPVLLVGAMVARLPATLNNTELASELGIVMGELHSALEDYYEKHNLAEIFDAAHKAART